MPTSTPALEEEAALPSPAETGPKMMLEFLRPEAVLTHLRGQNKKQILQEISVHAARLSGLDEATIFEVLLQRERLGSTGTGEGVAVPHGKFSRLDHVFGLVARLDKPIDFDAVDGQPVDLLFVLLAPHHAGADHLKALAQIARRLRQPGLVQRLRTARDSDALYMILNAEQQPKAA
jgi:nitrogen PTS system EIIA component